MIRNLNGLCWEPNHAQMLSKSGHLGLGTVLELHSVSILYMVQLVTQHPQ